MIARRQETDQGKRVLAFDLKHRSQLPTGVRGVSKKPHVFESPPPRFSVNSSLTEKPEDVLQSFLVQLLIC